ALVEKMVSIRGGAMNDSKPVKGHAYRQGDGYGCHEAGPPIKKMEEGSKQQIHAPVYAMGLHFTCEVCGNDGHSGNDCPKTREDCAYLNNNNNGYHTPQGGQGWNQPCPPFQGGNNNNSSFNSNFNSNQPPLRDLILGQAKIN